MTTEGDGYLFSLSRELNDGESSFICNEPRDDFSDIVNNEMLFQEDSKTVFRPNGLQSIDENQEYRTKYEDVYNDSRKLEFIGLVKYFPVLFDKNAVHQTNPQRQNQIWETIASILKITVIDCKAWWTFLEEKYALERKWQFDDPTRKPWKFLEVLSFLDVNYERSSSNFNSDFLKSEYTAYGEPMNQSSVVNFGLPTNSFASNKRKSVEEASEENYTSFANSANIPVDIKFQANFGLPHNPFAPKKIKFMEEANNENCTSIESSSNIPLPNNNSVFKRYDSNTLEDEDDAFCQSIAAEIRGITGQRKIKLKNDILKLIWEAECDEN